jgi:hypothetical protein
MNTIILGVFEITKFESWIAVLNPIYRIRPVTIIGKILFFFK